MYVQTKEKASEYDRGELDILALHLPRFYPMLKSSNDIQFFFQVK